MNTKLINLQKKLRTDGYPEEYISDNMVEYDIVYAICKEKDLSQYVKK